jgi:hypothetical protein
MTDIDTIIEATADSDDSYGLGLSKRSTPSRAREVAVAHLMFRFLQNCPEDATVTELRQLVEESKYSFR